MCIFYFMIFAFVSCNILLFFDFLGNVFYERECILKKYPEFEELFKIKAYKKSFIKKYKLQQKNERLIKSSIENLKEIEILDIELSVYEDKYFKKSEKDLYTCCRVPCNKKRKCTNSQKKYVSK